MRKYLVAAALGLASVGAIAQSNIDFSVDTSVAQLSGGLWKYSYTLVNNSTSTVAPENEIDFFVVPIFDDAASTTKIVGPLSSVGWELNFYQNNVYPPCGCTANLEVFDAQNNPKFEVMPGQTEGGFSITSTYAPAPYVMGLNSTFATAIGPGSPEALAAFSALAVPEPSTWALMLVGVAALGGFKRLRLGRHVD